MRQLTALVCLWFVACTAQTTPTFHTEGNPGLLSDWGQLAVKNGELVTAKGVQHYKLRTPLFSDYAQKHRTVWMPDGTSASYHPSDVFDFPVGTVITKTFYYQVPENAETLSGQVLKQPPTQAPVGTPIDLTKSRLIETRILARRESGWIALPYVWNDTQTEASLKRTGELITLNLVDSDTETSFAYQVPNTNQCAGCHATNNTTRAIQPIGPKERHLFVVEEHEGKIQAQLLDWEKKGLLSGASNSFSLFPQNSTAQDWSELEKQARLYLDINCSHCHSETGPADTSGLHLTPETPLGPHLGLCKTPIAAGRGTGNRKFGIIPGDADASIFAYRMNSTRPDIMMPELGRSLIHQEGVTLISEWINAMDGDCGS